MKVTATIIKQRSGQALQNIVALATVLTQICGTAGSDVTVNVGDTEGGISLYVGFVAVYIFGILTGWALAKWCKCPSIQVVETNNYTIIRDTGDAGSGEASPAVTFDKASQGPVTYTRYNRNPRFKPLPSYAWG